MKSRANPQLNPRLNRRQLLKSAGALSAYLLVDATLAQTLWIPSAQGQSISIASLQSQLSPMDADVLVPSDKLYAPMQATMNKRHESIRPQVRVLCKTENAVSICIHWAQQNNVPLAMRAGGHSYEGFSLSEGLVIDLRFMDQTSFSQNETLMTVGAGCLLGNAYKELAHRRRAIPAGTCPTVGITGHSTGGGYGLLTRPLGLACDSVVSMKLIDSRGETLLANESVNADLFWALRGGGSGNFGVVTELQFQTHEIHRVTTFVVRWRVGLTEAVRIAQIWQNWAPQAPNGITSLLNCTLRNGQIQLTLVGQSITSTPKLEDEIKTNFLNQIRSAPVTYKITPKTFIEAVQQFAGSNEAFYIKGKSDYVKRPHDEHALSDIFSKMPPAVAVIFDAYGGAIRNKSDGDTAFAHRENTICSIQYYLQWERASDTQRNLTMLREYYEALRPYMSGSAYFNYCDLDLGADYARAYWGQNLEQLVAVKNKFDPSNIFTHAQGVPLKIG
jgi:FAD binding domain/Berberine and berberine like